MIYDATALNLFRECPEKFRQRMVLHLVPDREEEAPASGAAFHAALRQWFHHPVSELVLAREALIEAWGEEPLFRALPAKRPRGLFEALLTAYAAKWPRERDNFEVLRNETWQEGRWPTFQYGGVVDRLIRLDGRTYVMDTKTTSSHLTETYFASYELSTQLRGYMALELIQGRECEGAMIDAVHVDTRSGKAKPEHCVRWGPIRYGQERLSAWARDAERTIREIERCLMECGPNERWEQRDISCRNWNRLCPYFERCQVAPELASTLPGYKAEAWEPNKRGATDELR